MSLADLDDLPATAQRVAEEARAGKLVVVTGPTGAGRWTLRSHLRSILAPSVVDVCLPPFEAQDAAAHGLVQFASALGDEAVSIACDGARTIGSRAQELSGLLAQSQGTLLVHVPESWSLTSHAASPGRLRRESRARDLFASWFESVPPRGAVVFIHNSSRDLLRNGAETISHQLPAPRAVRSGLDDAARWGPYAPAAEKVLAVKGVDALTPIQLRLLVAVAALGSDPAEIAPMLWGGAGQLSPLLDEIDALLADERHVEVARAVRRFLRSRFPLPQTVALRIAACPREHEPMLTQCIAYLHDGELRVPDMVRKRLMRWARTKPAVSTHYALAEHHKALDGAPRPPADLDRAIHWLERVHHLGHSAARGSHDWEELLPQLGPEQILERAWSSSVVHRDYSTAVTLYRKYLQRYGDDAYAWHYLGFNLQRMNAPSPETESAYRKALRAEPDNPWWNSRLVTFLIHDLRYDAAEKEWRNVIERLDPSGAKVERDAWLAQHVHRWVARAWLEHGEVGRAVAVFRTIPRHVVEQAPQLIALREQVEDAREAVVLGESVYPSEVPMRHRWLAPRVLAETKNDLPRAAWMPGRVLSVDHATVSLVVANPADRRVFKMTATIAEWKSWVGSEPRADQFFEIGFYGEAREVIEARTVPSGVPPVLSSASEDDEDLSAVTLA